MEKMKSLILLLFHRRWKTILLLTVLFTLSLVIFFLAGGAVNFVFTGDRYSRRFSAFDGYYIFNFQQPNQAEIDQISTMAGVDRILYPSIPLGIELERKQADQLTGTNLDVFAQDIVETIEMPFSADLNEIDLPQEGEIQIIVSDQVPLKVGDALPLKLMDGRSMNGVVVSTYSSRVPYLSFTRGSSATSFSSLLNIEPRILFWRDRNGLIEAQRDVYDPRPTGIGFLILMEKDLQPKTRKAVLSEIQKMQYYPQSLTEIAGNSAEERLEILKKELVIPVYMVIVSAIYILSSAFIDESRFGYRMAVYRLNGLSLKTQVFISTFPVFFSGMISLGVALAVKAFLSRGGSDSYLVSQNILIDGSIYVISGAFVFLLTIISLWFNWTLVRDITISEKIRKVKE